MTQNEDQMIRQLLESRLDALGDDLQEAHRELREGQERVERETSQKLERIEKQTTLTNGRVNNLELSNAKLRGAMAMLAFFGPILTGVVAAVLVEKLTT
jgi:hypothetical protein